jgi:Lon protease-like protein
VEGSRRFRIATTRVQADGLLWGEVQWLAEPGNGPVADEHQYLHDIMSGLAEHPALARLGVRGGWADRASLSWALAQYLPLEEAERYAVLAEPEPLARLAYLERLVKAMGSS